MSEPLFSLKLEAIPGSEINDTFSEASSIARNVGLAWVVFDFNGQQCTAYPNKRGMVMRGAGSGKKIVGEWTEARGIQWR